MLAFRVAFIFLQQTNNQSSWTKKGPTSLCLTNKNDAVRLAMIFTQSLDKEMGDSKKKPRVRPGNKKKKKSKRYRWGDVSINHW